MTFKLNNISKIFFTYFCPRFYGGAPSTPANTTSTTTVNQSPWQNPVYQALMLGTADNPGPITSMLNNNKALMNQYTAINTNGLPAAQQASLGSWNPAGSTTASYVNQLNTATGRYAPTANPALTPANTSSPTPTQTAAQGGIMGLKGYASGSTATTDTSTFINDTIQNLLGRPASQADLNYWTPRIDNGTISRDQFTAQTKTAPEAIQYAASNPTIAATANMSPSDKAAYLKQQQAAGTALPQSQISFLQNYADSSSNTWKGTIDPQTGIETPNPRGANQTSADYTKYLQGVQDAGGTIPTADATQYGVTATNNSPYTLTDTLGKTAYFDPTTGQTTNPGLLQLQQEAKNLSNPAVMDAGVAGLTQAYNKTQALANYNPSQVTTNKADVANANAANYNATQMVAPADISADQLQQYQMQGPQDITAPTATAAQMAGPQSWLAQGTAQAYMNPYQQAVTDQALYEANRQYQQQLNQLNAQAVGANAYGGSRQAIQQAEAARNNAINQAAIENTGLSNAYTQGTQQFNTAQGQQLQAGQANLGASQQTSLANQAAQIQAMMANQGMDFNTALQNLQAKLGVQNTQSAQDLQAAVQNQSTALTVAQQNQIATNAAAQYNAGNQQATNLANQQAANTANNAYTQNALAASQANQTAGLSANQQNLSAQNQAGNIATAGVNAGSAQNAATLANMEGQGAVAQATQGLAQSYLDQQSANATNWLNAPNTINSAVVNSINAQPTTGGTTANKNTSAPAAWARGGLIKNGKVSKRGNA